jgi:hypothetical protein
VALVDFLRANADIFAWSPSDMPGIPREVAEHSLDILPYSRAVQQRLRRFDEERRRAIGAELRKLLEAGFIKEVFHPTWLANPVLVKKKNGKWHMCIDYTSLNKACPKVPFPLPRIDQIVDSTAGCELLCFLDAYFGYHQIKMKESDQLTTSFITPFGMFCYVTMPFGLRNAGATYQRCMQHIFGDHIGRTVEAYVDDIVVKTRKMDDLVGDLSIAFGCLRANGVKLNPEKCVFGVPRGMLLGYIVSQRGIEANPEKVAALERMGPIRDLKGVQKVLGCLATLSRFISRLGEKGLPLYRLLMKLLLAHSGCGRQRNRAHLRRVPILRSQIQPPCSRPADHPHHMALRRVGARYHRALLKGARGLHPLVGCNRQIFQVGRGAPHHQPQG